MPGPFGLRAGLVREVRGKEIASSPNRGETDHRVAPLCHDDDGGRVGAGGGRVLSSARGNGSFGELVLPVRGDGDPASRHGDHTSPPPVSLSCSPRSPPSALAYRLHVHPRQRGPVRLGPLQAARHPGGRGRCPAPGLSGTRVLRRAPRAGWRVGTGSLRRPGAWGPPGYWSGARPRPRPGPGAGVGRGREARAGPGGRRLR